MLSSTVPHRGSNIYKHTLLAILKPRDASFFFSFFFSPTMAACCFLAREAHGLNFFCIILCFMFIFFFSVFSLSLFFFLLPFCVCPASMKPKSMRTRGVWVPAGVRGDQTLFECHMWGWLNRGQT